MHTVLVKCGYYGVVSRAGNLTEAQVKEDLDANALSCLDHFKC